MDIFYERSSGRIIATIDGPGHHPEMGVVLSTLNPEDIGRVDIPYRTIRTEKVIIGRGKNKRVLETKRLSPDASPAIARIIEDYDHGKSKLCGGKILFDVNGKIKKICPSVNSSQETGEGGAENPPAVGK